MNGDNKNNENKKKRFNIYNWMYGRNGRGVRKRDVIKNYNFENYFKLFGRKFRYIVNTNLFYIAGNFPIFFFILAISGNLSRQAVLPTSEMASVLYGLSAAGADTASLLPVAGIHGLSASFPVPIGADSLFVKILYALSLLLIFTFGLVNTGCAYVMRNVVKGEPIFLFDDFFGAIKRNWKMAIPMGIFDAVVLGLCAFATYSYYLNYSTQYILFFCSLVTLVIYLFMRFYMYMIMVTFKQSFFKVIKNSFIFAILCFGKNFLAFLGIALIAFITMVFAAVYTPIGVILLLVFVFGAATFTATYVAYPQMKKYMIDPYYDDEPEEEEEAEPIDAVPAPPAGKFGKAGGYGDDDGELYDAGEYVTDEDEFKTKKKNNE